MAHKGNYSDAPRCNAKSDILKSWLAGKGLLKTVGSKKDPKALGAVKVPLKKDKASGAKKKVVNFFSLFDEERSTSFVIENDAAYPGLQLEYYPDYFDEEEAASIVSHLAGLEFVPKRQFNRYAKPPRVTSSSVYYAWFSDLENAVHNFSKAHLNGFNPQRFTEKLEWIRAQIEETTGVYYNSVLINFYKDGKTALSAHSDDSPWLGDDFDVPSLSFGSSRDILFRGKKGTEAENSSSVKLAMEGGSLTIMKTSSTQTMWTHEIPVRAKKGWRLNMTFRDVKEELIGLNAHVQSTKQMKIAQEESLRPETLIDKSST